MLTSLLFQQKHPVINAMARQPRFVIPGQPQHVIQRGNNRKQRGQTRLK